MANFDNSSNYNKGRRTNQKQKLILIAAMATNRNILNYRTGDSAARRAREDVWKRIMLELNMAGPIKHTSEWRKVWTDLRLGMRKKWKKAQNSQYILTEYERRVIKACGMVENSEDEDYDENNPEDINSFLAFLKEELNKEHEPIQDNSDYFKEEEEDSNPKFNYLDDSNEFIICEPTEIIDIKEEEFNEEATNSLEYEEPAVECISDDEAATTFVEFREPSVECISDEEEPMIANGTRTESPPHVSYDEPSIVVPRPMQLQCPEMPSIPSSLPSNNKKIPRRKSFKDATLKEIKKMHRNLLRESKKQTALLRKLVRRMPQKNSYKS